MLTTHLRALWCLLALAVLLPLAPAAYAQTATPPPADGDAIEVQVSFLLVDLLRILDAEQSMEADLFYRLEWTDTRLAEPGAAQRTMALASIWHPALQPLAPRGLSELMPEEVVVDEHGRVRYAQRLTGRFGAPTHLHDSPFDQHELRFGFAIPSLHETRVELVAGPIAGVASKLTIPDWTISGGELDLEPVRVLEALPPRPGASLVLSAKRDISYYLTKVILPLR